MRQIIPPDKCPSCNEELTWKNDVLYCTNDNCPSRSQKAIEHWAKTLKIKGLGPKTIEKLKIDSIVDIYDLTEEFIEEALGSEKLATKLFEEIEKSKLAPLNIVLPAFGVPLIGNSASQKICSVIDCLDDFSLNAAAEAGLGPTATSNLNEWFNNKYLPYYKNSLDFSFKVEKRQELKTFEVTRGTVCITGKLKTFKTKKQAEEKLREIGYLVSPSLTKNVTILVNESGIESAKTQKARAAGLEIITNLNTLLGEK